VLPYGRIKATIMALTSWKEFPFFAVSQVPVPADEDGSYVFDVTPPFQKALQNCSLTIMIE
jgi:hypothetical protein